MRRLALMLLLAAAATAAHAAEQRFPPPDLGSDYRYPSETFPAPRGQWLSYVDFAALLAALSLASYLALKRRSRIALAVLALASVAYFGFFRRGCVCPIGAIQNVAAALWDGNYVLPLVVVGFFLLPLVFTVFFGRTFCASVCPLGAVQDLVLIRPLKVPAWLEHSLGLLPYLYLAVGAAVAAIGGAMLFCQYDPLVGFFRLGGPAVMIACGIVVLGVGMFVGRPYCRFACPYGALLRPLSALSLRHASITPGECIRCRLCEDACPYNAIIAPRDYAGVPGGRDKKLLAVLLLITPTLIAGGAMAGRRLASPLAQAHPSVQLAERVYLEETGKVQGVTDASTAFRRSGADVRQLLDQAAGLRRRAGVAGLLIGGLMGAIIGLKLISLTRRRASKDYRIDRWRCISCGRCFDYCPVGKVAAPQMQEAAAS